MKLWNIKQFNLFYSYGTLLTILWLLIILIFVLCDRQGTMIGGGYIVKKIGKIPKTCLKTSFENSIPSREIGKKRTIFHSVMTSMAIFAPNLNRSSSLNSQKSKPKSL